jgi:hypothetical protein
MDAQLRRELEGILSTDKGTRRVLLRAVQYWRECERDLPPQERTELREQIDTVRVMANILQGVEMTHSSIDDLIAAYATELQNIYDGRTAGDYTFIGVLSEFARAVQDEVSKSHAPVADMPEPDSISWSSHGHWIGVGGPSVRDRAARPILVARCGGPAVCGQCFQESRQSGIGLEGK